MTKKQTIHHELVQSKKTFDHMCDTIDIKIWKQQCADKPFSIGEVMMQLSSSLAFIPHVIKDIRRGKGFSPPPKIIMAIIRFFFIGFPGRNLTQKEIKVRYAIAYKRVMGLLDTIHEPEWNKKATFFGEEKTIEDVFKSYLQSFTSDIEMIQQIIEKEKLTSLKET